MQYFCLQGDFNCEFNAVKMDIYYANEAATGFGKL